MRTKQRDTWLEKFGEAKTLAEVVRRANRTAADLGTPPCETTERALRNEIKHLNSQVRKLRRERRRLTGLLDQHGVPHG